MIKNIVLDIGNVLIPFSWRQHLDHFGFSEEIKKTSDTIKNEFPVCPTCERPWDNHKEEHSTKNIKKVEKQTIVEENKIEKAEAFKVKRRTI